LKKEVRIAIIIIALMIIGYFSVSILLPFPYGLMGNWGVLGVGIYFLVQLKRRKFKFQQNG